MSRHNKGQPDVLVAEGGGAVAGCVLTLRHKHSELQMIMNRCFDRSIDHPGGSCHSTSTRRDSGLRGGADRRGRIPRHVPQLAAGSEHVRHFTAGADATERRVGHSDHKRGKERDKLLPSAN